MQKYFIIPLVIGLTAVIGWYFFQANPAVAPTSSEPAVTAEYVNASANDIVVASPKPGSTVGHVVEISGQARGMWYFEASFPIVIEDAAGNTIGQGIGTAEGEWMTEEFVPFKATIGLSNSYYGPAILVLKKDNPSGDAIRDASVLVPIVIR